jgi:hypothetical protein
VLSGQNCRHPGINGWLFAIMYPIKVCLTQVPRQLANLLCGSTAFNWFDYQKHVKIDISTNS